MDNASKALIMAGAVLISIALVGVGVFIFSSTNNMVDGANQTMDAAAAQMTNSTLMQYAGTNVRGTTVKQLQEYCRQLNVKNALPQPMTGDLTKAVDDNKYYTVSVSDALPTGNPDGYYDTISITP